MRLRHSFAWLPPACQKQQIGDVWRDMQWSAAHAADPPRKEEC